MNVNIVLNKSSDLSLTEGAPAFWSISFAGKLARKILNEY